MTDPWDVGDQHSAEPMVLDLGGCVACHAPCEGDWCGDCLERLGGPWGMTERRIHGTEDHQ